MSSDQRRLLLLDGHSLAFRAFYALPAEKFITSTGLYTNAVYGFVSMLINLLKEEHPSHIVCAFDESGPTFRSTEYSEYKAHRPPSPPEFSGQVELICQVLAALGIVTMSCADFEADDLIATAATQAASQGYTSYIVTGDRDALQLVNDTITVLYPKRGTSDMVRFTPETVQEKYGLTPTQYPDFAALRGDPSDNLPSVPKVGEKTAAKWIKEFGSLAELINHASTLKGAVGDSFRAHQETVLLNRRLTQLVTDVSLPVTISDMAVKSWDVDAIHKIFDQLEFSTLRERLLSLQDTKSTVAKREGFTIVDINLPPGLLGKWLSNHAAQGISGLYITGALQVNYAFADAISIAVPSGQGYHSALSELSPADSEALASWLADPQAHKVTFNAKGVAHALFASGYSLAGVVNDVQLAAYLVNPGQRSFTLEDLVIRYCKRPLKKQEDTTIQLQFDFEDKKNTAEDGIVYAYAICELSEILDVLLEKIEAKTLLDTIELPVQQVLSAMEASGIAADIQYLDDLIKQFTDAVNSAAHSAYDIVGEEVNLNSPKQLQVVLFDTLGMPKTKKIKTGYTTDAEALVFLYEKTGHLFLRYLLEHRDAQKLKVTVEGLAKSCGDDGRIHTTFNQTIAATGRLSSTDPNLQNIPVRTHAGRLIRNVFVVGHDYETLLTADYSQIEMRIMAHLCQDEGLIKAFHSGEDLHNYVGSQVFNVPITQVTPELRRRVKAMSYGLVYGLSAFGLGQQLKISTAEAGEHMEAYFSRFGKVRDYLYATVERARSTGYTETLYGRRRYFPDLVSDNRKQREIAERAALNAPIQGSAADIIKVAMINVHKALQQENLHSRLLLQIHDELIVEIFPGEKEKVTQLVKDKMSSVIDLLVPLEVSVGCGRSWNDAAHDYNDNSAYL